MSDKRNDRSTATERLMNAGNDTVVAFQNLVSTLRKDIYSTIITKGQAGKSGEAMQHMMMAVEQLDAALAQEDLVREVTLVQDITDTITVLNSPEDLKREDIVRIFQEAKELEDLAASPELSPVIASRPKM